MLTTNVNDEYVLSTVTIHYLYIPYIQSKDTHKKLGRVNVVQYTVNKGDFWTNAMTSNIQILLHIQKL